MQQQLLNNSWLKNSKKMPVFTGIFYLGPREIPKEFCWYNPAGICRCFLTFLFGQFVDQFLHFHPRIEFQHDLPCPATAFN